MMTEIYNQQKKKVGDLEVPNGVLDAKWRPSLIHQILVSQFSNSRVPVAHVKDRSEVSGGGRKPWRQKHTGRARHGSTRSPLWAHGGVTFGPRNERNFEKKINKKMGREALFSVLTDKFKKGNLIVFEDMELADGKTKTAVAFLKIFFGKEKPNVLLVAKKENKNIFQSAKNIKKAKVIEPNSLNVKDCLTYKNIFMERDCLSEISKKAR